MERPPWFATVISSTNCGRANGRCGSRRARTIPSLCILKVHPKSAEFWDNSGGKGMKYLFEGAKAVLQGHKPEIGEDQHGKVQL